MDLQQQQRALSAAGDVGKRHGSNAAQWAFPENAVHTDYLATLAQINAGVSPLAAPGLDSRYSLHDLCVLLEVPEDLAEAGELREQMRGAYDSAARTAYWHGVHAQIRRALGEAAA